LTPWKDIIEAIHETTIVGPKTEPWGTPQDGHMKDEEEPEVD